MCTAERAWREPVALPAACAVAAIEGDCWAAGQNEALRCTNITGAALHTYRMLFNSVRLDNQWAHISQPPHQL